MEVDPVMTAAAVRVGEHEATQPPYQLVEVEVDKALRKPHQIDAMLCSTVAWGELAPLFFFGTTDGALHSYVPTGGAAASLTFLRSHTTYKKMYHACAQFLDKWGVYATLVDTKVTMYALPLHTNPQVDGKASSALMRGNVRDFVTVVEETKSTVLFAVHETCKVVCTLSKQNVLKVFDWTVNATLEVRAQHELTAILATTTLLSPSVVPVQQMVILGESHALLVFKKEWCVVDLNSGKVLDLMHPEMHDMVQMEAITSAITVPQRFDRLHGARPRFQDALICGKHHALRVSIGDAHELPPYANGEPLRVDTEIAIEYNTAPRALFLHHPFLLLDMHDKVAVYNVGSMKPVQSVAVKSVYGGCAAVSSSMTTSDLSMKQQAPSFMMCAAPFRVHMLEMASVPSQIRQCIDSKRLEDAIVLTELCPDETSLLDDERQMLYAEYAVERFRRGQYESAMDYFWRARVSVMHVFHLYPRDLLPRSSVLQSQKSSAHSKAANSKLREPTPMALTGDELVKSLLALMAFMWKTREACTRAQRQRAGMTEEDRVTLGLIDTVLLKCLVLIGEKEEHQARAHTQLMEMVQIENWCEVGEAEVFLRAHNGFDALLSLYTSRKLHRKALELLEDLERSTSMGSVELAESENSNEIKKKSEDYVTQTADYLRRLGQQKADLVFEFSRRVIFTQPALGISIFVSRNIPKGVEDIDPAQIVNHLKSCHVQANIQLVAVPPPSTLVDSDTGSSSDHTPLHQYPESNLPLTESRFLAIEYLTQVIFKGKSSVSARLHDDAVYLMLDAINAELQQPRDNSTGAPRLTSRVEAQRGLLGQIRRTLMKFLEYPSTNYHPERMLSRTPHEMVDERAALLSRLGRHHEVLQVYALELRDASLAEAYCNRCYERKVADSSIYSTLLRLYLRPPLQSGYAASGVKLSTSPPSTSHVWQRSSSLQLATSPGAPLAATQSEAVNAAVNILNKYPERIDVPTALDLLPADVPMASLAPFFRRCLELQVERFRNGQVKKQLSKMENFKVHEKLTVKRKESVTVWSSHCCQVCNKKLGIGTFVRLPGGALLHYSCQPAQ